jgi:hypothetical protein
MEDMYNILPEHVRNLDILEAWKHKFLSMEYRMQLASDDMSLHKFGKTNMERYHEMKSDFIFKNFNDFMNREIDIENGSNNDQEDIPLKDVDSSYIESVIQKSGLPNLLPTEDNILSLKEDVNGKYGIVYVVLFSNDSIVSKLIRMWTKSDFSHCAIGFDKTLENIYSFAKDREDTTKNRVGFVRDNIKNYPDLNIKVYAIAIPFKYVYRLKKVFTEYIAHKMETSYNTLAILSIVINKQLRKLNEHFDKYSMICSQFVYTALSMCNIQLGINKVSPKDIDMTLDVKKNVIDTTECRVSEYDYKKFYRSVKSNIHSKDIILDESDLYINEEFSSEELPVYNTELQKSYIVPVEIDNDILLKLRDMENSGMIVMLADLQNYKKPEDYISNDIDILNKKYDRFNNMDVTAKELSNTSVQSVLNIDNVNLYKNILMNYCRKTIK